MSSIHLSNVLGAASSHQGVALSPALVRLLAVGAGLTVAALYYAQPMLGVLGAQLGVGPQTLGFVPMLTQLGYALGILLTAPLGDRCDRRTLVLVKCGWLVAALAGAALAPSIGWLLLASFAIGLAATAAQDIVPAAATLAPEARRTATHRLHPRADAGGDSGAEAHSAGGTATHGGAGCSAGGGGGDGGVLNILPSYPSASA